MVFSFTCSDGLVLQSPRGILDDILEQRMEAEEQLQGAVEGEEDDNLELQLEVPTVAQHNKVEHLGAQDSSFCETSVTKGCTLARKN